MISTRVTVGIKDYVFLPFNAMIPLTPSVYVVMIDIKTIGSNDAMFFRMALLFSM